MPPKIDPEKCNGCGRCIFDCGAYVLELSPETDQARLIGKGCVDCFLCELACPTEAIQIMVGKDLGGVGGKAFARQY